MRFCRNILLPALVCLAAPSTSLAAAVWPPPRANLEQYLEKFCRQESGRKKVALVEKTFRAVERGDVSLVKELLTANPELANEMDYLGDHCHYRLLDVAAINGDKEMVRLLLAYHADVNHKYEQGQTALDFARERGHTEIVALLREHGSKSRKDSFGYRFFGNFTIERMFLPWLFLSALFLIFCKVVEKTHPTFSAHVLCAVAWIQLLSWSIPMSAPRGSGLGYFGPVPLPSTLLLLLWLGDASPHAKFPSLAVASYLVVGVITAFIKLMPRDNQSEKK